MSITVVGSIAFDAVKTPFGSRDRMLGGAATHFALAASFFDKVHVVGPVGDDFGAEDMAVLATRDTDVSDVERVSGGRTFFWQGEYGWDLNSRETLVTELNVFEQFQPKLSAASRDCDVLFLANIQPELQLSVLEQCAAPKLVAMDSMNLWIDIARDALIEVIRRVDCVILNDAELRQLTNRPNLLAAAQDVLDLGPSIVVAKQGEYGAALVTRRGGAGAGGGARGVARDVAGGAATDAARAAATDAARAAATDAARAAATDAARNGAGSARDPQIEFFALPAYPLETVVDPTGAGDTFAGGFVGHLARNLGELGAASFASGGSDHAADHVLRQAMAYGTALASFNVEAFGTERVHGLTADEIRARVDDLRRMTQFEHDPITLA